MHVFLILPYPSLLGPISTGVLTKFLYFLIIISTHATFLIYLVFADFITVIILMNMVLRRIFGPRRDEVTGEWRRLHNQELNDLYCSPNIVRVIKWRRMRWAGHVARMGEETGGV